MAQLGVGDRDPEIDAPCGDSDGGQDREGFPGRAFVAHPEGVDTHRFGDLSSPNELRDGFVGEGPYRGPHSRGFAGAACWTFVCRSRAWWMCRHDVTNDSTEPRAAQPTLANVRHLTWEASSNRWQRRSVR